MEGIECNNFIFFNNFDSANLGKVEYVAPKDSTVLPSGPSNGPYSRFSPELPDIEFNVWPKPDCFGTEFQNVNRTWFYFGVQAPTGGQIVRLNIVDLNRQGKMYSQGMAPVFRIIPGKPNWDRIKDKPYYRNENDVFILSFKFKTPENPESITYFAFTYPFSYTDNQKMLERLDRFSLLVPQSEDDIYYKRELLCYSLQGREVNLLTISSFYGIKDERESRLKNLFPNKNEERPFKFDKKKVIFLSARVHPGETPSTFVFNGFLNLLLTRDDPVAIQLRRIYVFKLIPMLNPDGVAVGHYRTDTRGVNLNRYYLNPVFSLHPSIYGARALIRYYHFGSEKEDIIREDGKIDEQVQKDNISAKVSTMNLEELALCEYCQLSRSLPPNLKSEAKYCEICGRTIDRTESGLFLYMDMHGHATKKGIFMYGNHFHDLNRNVDCMMLPKIMSINSHHFHFTSCNFTERNMYLKDKRDGLSREGCGRVAVWKLTGLTKSYTLECNYNTGRIVNILPPIVRESHPKTLSIPPKYTPQLFEEVGKSLGVSILDLTGHNPSSRIPHSEFHNLAGLKEWLENNYCKNWPSISIKVGKGQEKPSTAKGRQSTVKMLTKKIIKRPSTVPVEKKENVIAGTQPSCSKSADRVPRNKPPIRLTKSLEIRKSKTKTGKEKSKNVIVKKMKSRIDVTATVTTKSTTNNDKNQDRIKLREICVIKTNEKKTALKYLPAQTVVKKVFKNDLIVSWETSPSTTITPSNNNNNNSNSSNNNNNNNNSNDTNSNSNNNNNNNSKLKVALNTSIQSVPGPSKDGNILLQNYSKKTFIKTKKKHLRRLASTADNSGKIDKTTSKTNTTNSNNNLKKKKLKGI